MSANISSSFTSLLLFHCGNIQLVFDITRIILILPFSIIILYLGLQKWRQQHSFRMASHSDLFTYHLAAMELVWVLGCLCFFSNYYINNAVLQSVGMCLLFCVYYGEVIFHVLICAERYLAVVHPVIYRGLKNARGVRIRNISIGSVWVLSFLLMISRVFISNNNEIEFFSLLAISIIVTCYCSVSVLCVLTRPGPGDGSRAKERVDQSKQRAFYTITAITASLWLWFIAMLVGFAMEIAVSTGVSCLVVTNLSFLNLPFCLVSPLLYLHRTGKLPIRCCSRK